MHINVSCALNSVRLFCPSVCSFVCAFVSCHCLFAAAAPAARSLRFSLFVFFPLSLLFLSFSCSLSVSYTIVVFAIFSSHRNLSTFDLNGDPLLLHGLNSVLSCNIKSKLDPNSHHIEFIILKKYHVT